MTQKADAPNPVSVTPENDLECDFDWDGEDMDLLRTGEDEDMELRAGEDEKPAPSERLVAMSNLAAHLGNANEPATLADIETLQMLARGDDIDIDALEI